jgi:hypothetical protein
MKQGMQSKSLTKKIEQILEQDVLRLIVKACGNLEPYTLSCLVKFITKNIVKGAKRGFRKELKASSKSKKYFYFDITGETARTQDSREYPDRRRKALRK